MKSLKQASYTGKEVFIGIDVHKKSYSVVARVDQAVVKKWTTVASPKELSQQLVKYFNGATIHSVYEAGFSGFALHRELVKHGINNIVVHAASIEVAANNRVKTDKRDAQKMAALLEAGRLKGNRVPSEQQEQRRMLTRTRQQLVEDRAAIKNKIRMKFHQWGLIEADENRSMSHKLVQQLLSRVTAAEFKIAIESDGNVWKKLDEEICKLTQAIKEQAKTDPNEVTYRSVPGIGPLSARILANELGEMSQFNNERQLFDSTGLNPCEYSSGENIRRGHISRQGNSRLRGILVEIAWRAVEKDKALGKFFKRLYPRTGKKRAIVAVARKLIGRIRAAFQRGVHYQMEYSTSESVTA